VWKLGRCLPSPTLLTSFKTRNSFVLRKNVPMFCSSATLISETVGLHVFGFGWNFQKSFVPRSPDMISAGVQIWIVRWPLFFFLIICRQFACRHCWATRAVCTEPHASHWICRCVRQQSVAVFRLRKHKLINNFSYCSQNITTKITLQRHRCRVKLVEINEWELVIWKLNAQNLQVAAFNLK